MTFKTGRDVVIQGSEFGIVEARRMDNNAYDTILHNMSSVKFGRPILMETCPVAWVLLARFGVLIQGQRPPLTDDNCHPRVNINARKLAVAR